MRLLRLPVCLESNGCGPQDGCIGCLDEVSYSTPEARLEVSLPLPRDPCGNWGLSGRRRRECIQKRHTQATCQKIKATWCFNFFITQISNHFANWNMYQRDNLLTLFPRTWGQRIGESPSSGKAPPTWESEFGSLSRSVSALKSQSLPAPTFFPLRIKGWV